MSFTIWFWTTVTTLAIKTDAIANQYFRVCPGRFLAESTMWMTMAMILATCKVGKAKDANGTEITPEVKFDIGFVKYVLFFIRNCALNHDTSLAI